MNKISQDIQFDEDGFLVDPGKWDRSLAEDLAENDGVAPLTEAHWSIIESIREYYFDNGGVPAFAHVCHLHHMNSHCVEELFGNSPRKAWRIAGLPNPGEEAKAYM